MSANPDISIRTRDPHSILAEMHQLRGAGVTAFRFVDSCGDWAAWDATGRINVLHRASDITLDTLADNGLREVPG